MKTESTYIPAGYYLSKSRAARVLNMPLSTLQYHIGQRHIDTIYMPGMGHLIREGDVLDFVVTPQGRPSIYSKK